MLHILVQGHAGGCQSRLNSVLLSNQMLTPPRSTICLASPPYFSLVAADVRRLQLRRNPALHTSRIVLDCASALGAFEYRRAAIATGTLSEFRVQGHFKFFNFHFAFCISPQRGDR